MVTPIKMVLRVDFTMEVEAPSAKMPSKAAATDVGTVVMLGEMDAVAS